MTRAGFRPARLVAATAALGLFPLAGCSPTGGARSPATAARSGTSNPAARKRPAAKHPSDDTPRRAARRSSARLGTGTLRRVDKAETLTIGLGGHVQVPARWWVRPASAKQAWTDLRGPDRQLRVTLVAVRTSSPEAAIAAAWRRARPGRVLQVKTTTRPPAGGGWDAVVQIVYVTPSTGQRLRLALARSKGTTTFVALLETPIAALGRRAAQLKELLGNLKAPGVVEESFARKTAHRLDAKRLAAFEAFVRKARKELGVVGTSVALVQGGKVIFKKGFGLRRLGGRARVTPRTIFMIGSITKTFTGMLMARLVDEKRFGWDTPVTTVYPRFALGDPTTTRRCHMRHTLCACTGLPRQDMEFLFQYRGATAESRMKLLATMRPTTDFGETFQYSNLMVSAAGYIAGHAAYPKLRLGPAYAKALTTRILGPLGMRHTTLSMRRARRLEHATPHAPNLEDHPVPIPLSYENTVESVGPAGGLWSNVEDMARFAQLQLSKGRTPEGRRLVSEKNVEVLRRPGARMDAHRAYGLAMVVGRRYGIRILGHGGGTLGFSTNLVFLPDQGVALVSLHNVGGGSGGFNSLIFRRLLELLFDGKPKAEARLAFVVRERAKARVRGAKHIEHKPAAAWLRQIAGTYSNAALGRIVIRVRRGRAELDAGEWRAPLARLSSKDGASHVVLGPPLAGLRLEPGRRPDGARTLTLHAVQKRYVFVEGH